MWYFYCSSILVHLTSRYSNTSRHRTFWSRLVPVITERKGDSLTCGDEILILWNAQCSTQYSQNYTSGRSVPCSQHFLVFRSRVSFTECLHAHYMPRPSYMPGLHHPSNWRNSVCCVLRLTALFPHSGTQAHTFHSVTHTHAYRTDLNADPRVRTFPAHTPCVLLTILSQSHIQNLSPRTPDLVTSPRLRQYFPTLQTSDTDAEAALGIRGA